jgi:GrpB-like predicted nucleotidyltransferase (UPF0157 family)
MPRAAAVAVRPFLWMAHSATMREAIERTWGWFEQWQALLFRDHLRARADVAREYEALKRRLAEAYPNDRVAYMKEKTSFVTRII